MVPHGFVHRYSLATAVDNKLLSNLVLTFTSLYGDIGVACHIIHFIFSWGLSFGAS